MSSADVAVVGLGPAGRALAHRLATHGARVFAVDPQPGRRWQPTYGGWRSQLPAWLGDEVVGAVSSDTRLVAHGNHRLVGDYVVLDNEALQRQLTLPGVEVVDRWVSEEDFAGLAPVVVDCRGNRRGRPRDGVVQTAHGVRLSAEAGARVLEGAQAVLMDWRPFDGSPVWGCRRPSFCYVVPLPDGRVLAEETCLAGRPPLERAELASRLATRLARSGVAARDWDEGDTEWVHIPMLPASSGATVRFGAAGGEVNPITGYSVFASLASADQAATELLAGGNPTAAQSPWRRRALEALLQLPPDGVVDLFDAFGRLPAAAQRAVLDPRASTPELLAALGRQWTLMPGRHRLVTATARGLVATGATTVGSVRPTTGGTR